MNSPIYEVGAPYIYEMDKPCADMIVICTHPSGKGRYLCIKSGLRWPHELTFYPQTIPLSRYGVEAVMEEGAIVVRQVAESHAHYRDGAKQRWQGPKSATLPLLAPDPSYWRLDRLLLPKFRRWIAAHPQQVILP